MSQLNPPVTTATGTLPKVYRKVAMPLTEKGKMIMGHMKEEYGDKKGESVFYASANKGKIKGVHGSPARVHLKKEKAPRGIARSFLKADSRGEDTQLHRDELAPGGTEEGMHSAPTGRQPAARAAINEQTHGEQQDTRRGLTEGPPAGTPTIAAGAPMKRLGTNQAHRPPSPPQGSMVDDEIAVPGRRSIEEAIEQGGKDFSAQVTRRSQTVRDRRKRSAERHR